MQKAQHTQDFVFYRCPYCEKPPLKARSSLKKHFLREHKSEINEWKVSNFMSKQIIRDEGQLKNLRKKYYEKKRLRVLATEKFLLNFKNMRNDETSTTTNNVKSLEFNEHTNAPTTIMFANENNKFCRSNMHRKYIKKKESNKKNNSFSKTKLMYWNNNINIVDDDCSDSANNSDAPRNHLNTFFECGSNLIINCNTSPKKVMCNKDKLQQKQFLDVNSNHEILYKTSLNVDSSFGSSSTSDESGHILDNLFLENLDNLLDPLNENTYSTGEDHAIQSVNYIQETFQNSFEQIQEKLDAELEVGHGQLNWENTLNSEESNESVSNGLYNLDEKIMLV